MQPTSLLLTTAIAAFSLVAAQINDTLVPLVFKPLPLSSIKPAGWLKDQLQLMSDGLAGHEYDFYAYVAHSSWLGGEEEYSSLNEGFPYWLNGLVPLAYSLDDARLKDQVHSSVQIVLSRQGDDGWIGPETGTARNFWARYPLCLGLIQLAEANSTWTEPILDSLHRFTQLMHDMLAQNYTGYLYHEGDKLSADDDSWGRVRSQDMMITLQWLYEYHPGNQSQVLLDNMKYLHNQGLNWEDWYNEAAYFGQGMNKDLNTLRLDLTTINYPYEHGVNVGQGLKAPAVVRRFTHNDSLIQTAEDGVNWTMQYHGASSGTVLADERLVGVAPYSGSELCTSVETMYSLSYLYQALGTNEYADRAELAAFNSLPAMLTPDWWGRQYMAQPNQPYAQNLSETPFYNTNSWGQAFGLEPWPKFLSNSYVKVGDNGLAHVLLSPGSAEAILSGGKVTVTATTAYPFLEQLSYTITATAPFDFYVRVPAWAGSSSSLSVGNNSCQPLSPDPATGLHKLSIPRGTATVSYLVSSSIRTESRENDTVAVYKGPLLYALDISNTNTSTLPKPFNDPSTYFNASYAPPESRDWEYHNTSAWNYAIDPSTLTYHSPEDVSASYELVNPIFASGVAPGYMTVRGCEIEWPLFLGSVPGYPPTSEAKKCVSAAQEVRLVPYGSAKTHMAELPVIDLGGT
ncbi:hypothetical protein LTR56_027374 [Elasticomyces elasticus]|nr:hypothetical protein LTR56_027374 [Elasticomyces elasticus]